ncbi:maturase K [Bienertia sinuspersici]
MEENEPQSNSPGVAPIQLSQCLEDLLKLVLQSSANGTLEFNLGLSSNFCSSLLKCDDHTHHQLPPTSNESFEGVPQYPLYKHLASALEQWIISGTFFSTINNVAILCEDDSINEKKDYWNDLVSQKGSELVEMLKSIKFELHVQEPYFSQLKDGMKTVEGRCAVGNYNRIESGDLIFFNKCLMLEVQDIRHYSSFLEMLGTENLEDVLPGGLGYRGIQSLLGLKQTAGTIPEALPPPRSTLFSSFALLHNSNIKGCTLTEGARALTKHVNRCSSKYWGKVEGNDSMKNQRAIDVITRIISHCQWLNVHIVKPHYAVFEVRIPEGYGARWSADGTKFIGFLEPYMEDGHSKKWRH